MQGPRSPLLFDPAFMRPLGVALMTAAFVGTLLLLLSRLGPRASGFGAAVPVLSMPALLLLSMEHEGNFAARAAEASLWATAMVALAVQTYGWISQRLSGSMSVALTLLAAGACAALSLAWARAPVLTLMLTILLSSAPLPRAGLSAARASPARTELWLTVGFAVVTAPLIDWLGSHAGPAWAGVVPAFPVVGLCGLWASHVQGGREMQCHFLRGYLDGMLAKAAFLAAAALALRAGFGTAAWGLGLAGGLSALMLQRGWRRVVVPSKLTA